MVLRSLAFGATCAVGGVLLGASEHNTVSTLVARAEALVLGSSSGTRARAHARACADYQPVSSPTTRLCVCTRTAGWVDGCRTACVRRVRRVRRVAPMACVAYVCLDIHTPAHPLQAL